MSALRDVLTAACHALTCSAKDLTVLATQNDPYRHDNDTGRTEGAWIAEQTERLLDPWRVIHLRGLHYVLVSAGVVVKPNGAPYRNTEQDWLWLQSSAKAARWLRYIPFDRITDERNAAPIIRTNAPSEPETYISVTSQFAMPSRLAPRIQLTEFYGRQAYNLVFYGEKTSLGEVLDPIAERHDASLYLPAGEISDTQLHTMAKVGAEDGRPMVVFIFADFDPAGHQMAVSIGRKLQALKDLLFPDLEFSVYPVALTADQVREFDLPSTPLKDTERRADRWRAAHDGLEQTEIDALATLRPDVLRDIALEAIAPFYDYDLEERVEAAASEWLSDAREQLAQSLDSELLEQIEATERELAAVRDKVDRLNTTLHATIRHIEIEPPEVPEAEPPGGYGKPLLDSSWPWADQTRALIERKRYAVNGDAS